MDGVGAGGGPEAQADEESSGGVAKEPQLQPRAQAREGEEEKEEEDAELQQVEVQDTGKGEEEGEEEEVAVLLPFLTGALIEARQRPIPIPEALQEVAVPLAEEAQEEVPSLIVCPYLPIIASCTGGDPARFQMSSSPEAPEDWVPYSTRDEWADVTPLPQVPGQE